MRLTLRTLLSWKDGMLADDVAGAMAARVEGSEAARRVIERIDDVVSRPTLSAPAPDAAGFASDANSTADYLDNVLPPGQLAEFERVCFASDPHLAETAATHEMLATWSREPAPPLDAAARRRLVALVRSRDGGGPSSHDAVVQPAAPRRAGRRAASRPAVTARASTPAPASAWLLVLAALVLLVGLVGVLGWSLTRGRRAVGGGRDVAARAAEPSEPVASAPAPREPDVPEAAPPAPAAGAFAEPDAAMDGAAPVAAPDGAAPAEVGAPSPVADDMPVADPAAEAPPIDPNPGAVAAPAPAEPAAPAPPPAGGAAPAAVARVPQGDALAIAAPPPPVAPGGAAPAAAPNAAAPAPRAAGASVKSGVLLQRPAGAAADAWLAAAASEIELPADLVAPPFGVPTLGVDGLSIALEPGTRATLTRDLDGIPRVEVVFGAATVAATGRFGVTAGDLSGVVDAGLAAPVGIEVALARRPGATAEATERIARVVPTAGRLAWRQSGVDGGERDRLVGGIDATCEIPSGRALEWRSGAADGAALVPVSPLPPWLAGRRGDDRLDALAAGALGGRLAAGTAALPALRELVGDRRIEGRMAAAATLALVGEFDALARLLVAEGRGAPREHEWLRLDAVAVQPALARGPRAADAFARAVAAHAPAGSADTIVRLARGLADDEFDAGGATELVAALESPHLVVRRYAIRNLVDITGAGGTDRTQYRADWPDETMRARGAAWWRTGLEQGRVRRGTAPAGSDR